MADGLVLADLVAGDFDYPSSSYASPDKAYGRETVVFADGAATLAISRPQWMPLGRTGAALKVVVCWKAPSNPSPTKTVTWKIDFEPYVQGETVLTSDNFYTAGVQSVSGETPSTAHTPVYTSIEFDNAQAASIEPGTMFRIRIIRDTVVDDYAGNAELLGLLVYEYDPE